MKKFTKVVFLLLVVATFFNVEPVKAKAMEDYYDDAIEIPVSITTDNPLVSATCVPEFEHLERTWYSIGVDGEYGTFKWYCERGTNPRLSLNVQVVGEWVGIDPIDWEYNFNLPNIVKRGEKTLYSLMYRVGTPYNKNYKYDKKYLLHLGIAERFAIRPSENFSFQDIRYTDSKNREYGSNYVIFEKGESIYLSFYEAPSDFTEKFTEFRDKWFNFIPAMKYQANNYSPREKDVSITISIENEKYGDYNIYFYKNDTYGDHNTNFHLRAKPELRESPDWETPRWTINLRDLSKDYLGRPIRIGYHDKVKITVCSSLRGWTETKLSLSTDWGRMNSYYVEISENGEERAVNEGKVINFIEDCSFEIYRYPEQPLDIQIFFFDEP